MIDKHFLDVARGRKRMCCPGRFDDHLDLSTNFTGQCEFPCVAIE